MVNCDHAFFWMRYAYKRNISTIIVGGAGSVDIDREGIRQSGVTVIIGRFHLEVELLIRRRLGLRQIEPANVILARHVLDQRHVEQVIDSGFPGDRVVSLDAGHGR